MRKQSSHRRRRTTRDARPTVEDPGARADALVSMQIEHLEKLLAERAARMEVSERRSRFSNAW